MADKNKKKKKWKKRIGKALLAGAALAGGLALAKRGRRNASMANVEGAESGFGDMKLKDYGPHRIGGYHTPKWTSTNPLANKNWNKMDTSEVDMNYVAPSTEKYRNSDFGLGPWAAKKGGRAGHKSGGRVGVGKAKRGFGRALKKGK